VPACRLTVKDRGAATPEQIGQQRPRLVVVDSLAISTTLDPYLSLHALAKYTSMSVRWLRDRLEDPRHPLAHYRLGGKIVVRRSDYDAWALAYRRTGRDDVEQIVNEVLRDLR
jgi:hypothetical protein